MRVLRLHWPQKETGDRQTMNRVAIVGFLVLAIAGLQFSGTFSFTDIIDQGTCEWKDLEIDGETFDSKQELEQAYPDDFEEQKDEADFRVRDGVLQYRLSGCGGGSF